MPSKLAPLSFSQLAHWQLYRLSERKSYRSVASVVRLGGTWDEGALNASFTALIKRHEALRTRIVVENGTPAQAIDEPRAFRVPVCDLTALSQTQQPQHIQRHIERVIIEPVDVSVGPLFAAELLKLSSDEHLLIIAAEHMISDARSLSILLRELCDGYAQAAKGESVRWAAPALQFSEHAIRQQKSLRPAAHFYERLQGYPRIKFPGHNESGTGKPGWGIVPVEIGSERSAALRDWSRARQTTLAMSVFTAYVAAVLMWCRVCEGVVRYQSDGRAHTTMRNAIGFYASRLYLRTELREHDRFIDLQKRLTQELCLAHELDDVCFLETQSCPPACARNTFFNWIPAERDLAGYDLQPFSFENPWFRVVQWDNEPMVLLRDSAAGIAGGVHFPLQRLSAHSVSGFVRQFMQLIDQLLTDPHRCIHESLQVCTH
jgi:Condensation domain